MTGIKIYPMMETRMVRPDRPSTDVRLYAGSETLRTFKVFCGSLIESFISYFDLV
jgi:hypothetical protein